MINVTKAQISDIERGKKSTTLENVVILAEYFKVSLDYLTGRSDIPDMFNNKQKLTEEELELLEDFRLLNKYEQNIIMGKISEIIYNKNIENNNIKAAEIVEIDYKVNK